MNKLDNEFFETYKDVENYCSNMLNKEHGVSEYITELEKIGKNNTEEYKTIKHLRWVRNQIAHNSNDKKFATKKDLEDLKLFYSSLKNKTDILSTKNVNNKSPFSTLIKVFIYITVLFIIYLMVTGK